MKYKKWVGRRLDDLRLPWEQFTILHPEIKKTNYRALRRYHKIKGDNPMPHTPESEPSFEKEPIKRLVSESEYDAWIKNSDGEIESEPKVARRYEYIYDDSPEETLDTYFPQIEPTKITPTRRKRAKRLGSLIMAYGDGQTGFRIIRDPRTLDTEIVPLHNLEQHRIILQMNAYYMPETTINGGDFADFPEFSRFPADSDHFQGSLTYTMRWIHDFYRQLVTDNPNAEHRELDSNHAARPKNKILDKMPELYNFYRPGEDYPAHTYYSMARLGDLGIKMATGYPAIRYIHEPDSPNPIDFHHGSTSSSKPGVTVNKEMLASPNRTVVRFHGHNYEIIARTAEDGRQLYYIQLPSSCDNRGPVPGYGSAVDDQNRPVKYHNPNHQNGFMMIRTSPSGMREYVFIEVIDGKAWYDGIEWDGTKPFDWEYEYKYIKEDDDGNI